MLKKCTKCGIFKDSEEDFHKDRQKSGGRCTSCKDCNSEYRRLANAKDPTKNRLRVKEWTRANPDRAKALVSEWNKNNLTSELNRIYALKYKYGKTFKELEDMWNRQGGTCAICKDEILCLKASVDHDHQCCPTNNSKKACGNCVRGLLCKPCNSGLGFFRDNIDTLLSAAQYLKEYHSEPQQ